MAVEENLMVVLEMQALVVLAEVQQEVKVLMDPLQLLTQAAEAAEAV